MRHGSRFLLLSLTASLMSGCSVFAPGMQMRSASLTPGVNAHSQIVQPKIIPITPALIQKEQQDAELAKAFAIKHYRLPKGFTANTRFYHYHVGPQDVLQVTVWNQAENDGSNTSLTQSLSRNSVSSMAGAAPSSSDISSGFIVDSKGDIFYPYLGDVHVAGLSTRTIRKNLTRRLARYIKNPQVTVKVLQFNSQQVAVTGAVHKPTTLPVTTTPLNVLSAVTMAGGPIRCGIITSGMVSSLCADLQNVQLRRAGKTYYLNLNKLTAINGSSNNWLLKNNDVVYVPNNNDSRIFILGQVNAPGGYNMVDGSMTLREAIGDAKGMSAGANPRYTYIIRNYHHNPKLFSLNLKSPDALNLAGDFGMKPGDVVFVSTSALHDFNAVLNEITPTLLTAVSIKSLTHWR